MFKRLKKKKIKSEKPNIVDEYTKILLCNDHIDIVADACAECYQVNTEKTYEEKQEYIRKRIATGHESILEHSNIVMLIHINKDKLKELSYILPYFRYLNYRIKYDDYSIYLLIGGSIRGYKHIFRNVDDLNNSILGFIKNGLYESSNSCYFEDFIKVGIMEDRFLNIPREINPIDGTNMTLVNVDDIYIIIDELEKLKLYEDNHTIINGDCLFNINDLMDMCTVTIHWKKVSRVISQQLTRHRAAITQKSQRYVNYSNTEFLSPDQFKPDKYDSNKEYSVSLSIPNKDSVELTGTLKEIGTGMLTIYTDLFKQGLLKEDARAYLPNNVETSLYMTYTLRQFIFVIKLRTDAAAQAEIQLLFNEAKSLFNKVNMDSYDNLLPFISPRYEQLLEFNKNGRFSYDGLEEELE